MREISSDPRAGQTIGSNALLSTTLSAVLDRWGFPSPVKRFPLGPI